MLLQGAQDNLGILFELNFQFLLPGLSLETTEQRNLIRPLESVPDASTCLHEPLYCPYAQILNSIISQAPCRAILKCYGNF